MENKEEYSLATAETFPPSLDSKSFNDSFAFVGSFSGTVKLLQIKSFQLILIKILGV